MRLFIVLLIIMNLSGLFGSPAHAQSSGKMGELRIRELVSTTDAALSGQARETVLLRLEEELLKYRDAPKSPELQKLYDVALTRVMSVSLINKGMKSCGEEKFTSKTMKQISTAASVSEKEGYLCSQNFQRDRAPSQGAENLNEWWNATETRILTPTPQEFKGEIIDQGLKNSMKTLVSLSYTYGKGQAAPDVASLSKELCPTAICTEQDRKNLTLIGSMYLEKIQKEKSEQFTPDEAFSDLNGKLEFLNSELKKIGPPHVETPFEWIGLKPTTLSATRFKERRQKAIDEYTEKFYALANTNPGLLLFTETIRSDVETLIKTQFNTKTLKIDSHHLLKNPSIVSDAIAEAKRKTIEGAATLIEQRKSRDPEILTELVAKNPVAVGQVLLENPSYTGIACQQIKNLESDRRWDDQKNKIAMWGGAIVGGALMLTGVGELMLGAGALGLGVGTASAVGAGLATTEIAYFGHEALSEREDYRSLQRSFFSGNADATGFAESEAALGRFKSARTQVIMNGIFAPLDLGMLGLAYRQSAKTGSKLALASEKGTSYLEEISHSPIARTLNTIEEASSDAKITKFHTLLSQMPDELRSKMLKRMEGLNPEEFEKLVTKLSRQIPECGADCLAKAEQFFGKELGLKKVASIEELPADLQGSGGKAKIMRFEDGTKGFYKDLADQGKACLRCEVAYYEMTQYFQKGSELVPETRWIEFVDESGNFRKGRWQKPVEGEGIVDPLKGLTKQQIAKMKFKKADDGMGNFYDYLTSHHDRPANFLIDTKKGKEVFHDNDLTFFTEDLGSGMNDDLLRQWTQGQNIPELATKTDELLKATDDLLANGPGALAKHPETAPILGEFDVTHPEDVIRLKLFRSKTKKVRDKFKFWAKSL